MAMTAAQKKAAQKLIDKANAQKVKLQAQVDALNAQKAADAAAAKAEAARIAAETKAEQNWMTSFVGSMGGTVDFTTNTVNIPEPKGTTARAVLEGMLRDAGISNDILASSINFLESLSQSGIADSAMMDIYFNNPSFTKKDGTAISSPFYSKYTALTSGLINPQTNKPWTAKDAFAWRTGIENKVDQYGYSPFYKSEDVLKKLATNGVSVDDWEGRMQEANLAAINADPNKTTALIKMGYIKDAAGLKDFYLNPEIGQKQLEENKRIGAFATEAIRFGVGFDKERITQVEKLYEQNTQGKDYQTYAQDLYSGVAENLQQTIALAGMYDKTGLTATQEATPVQTELENEIISKLPSERRKRLAETNIRAFEGKSGTGQGSISTKPTLGLL